MTCPSCRHANSAAARFCEGCGTALPRACSGCGEALSASARFCSQCGHAADPATPPVAPAPSPPTGERRQITAMFCDLAGSTELSERLDGEDLRELIATYQDACSNAVQKFDGHVAQFLGDGVLVYFGFPRAHEDDAQRAILAALAIQATLAQVNEGRGGVGAPVIRARIGIHSGPVVVSRLGGDGRQETLALGETMNIAARLDALAPPGGVVASEAALRLAPGVFVTRDLGTPELKGVSHPLRVYAVERALGATRRGRAVAATPLRGRDRELGLLLDRWELAQEGRGQVVSLSGEPGIGKSRLLMAFREQIATSAHSAVELQCSPYATGSAFQPSLESFQRGLGFEEEESAASSLAKLEAGMAQLPGLDLAEVVPYLGALLGLPASARFPLEHMSAEVQREKTLRALAAPILAMERIQPVVVLIEDLHWADPSTLELIGLLIEAAPTLRLLLVLTFRPSFEPSWPPGRSFVTPLALARLGRRSTQQLIEASAGLALPERVLEDIAARADGVPLFAEELARAVIESGVVVEANGRYELRGRLADVSIPTTLQGSLMARLDRLSDARPIAQIGATLGREFSFALIEAVGDLDGAALRSGLAQLVASEILFARGAPPDATYTFKHALLQDTAYESQLRSRRRELHARAAAALEERFPARVAAEPQIVARHCAEGGLTARAIEHYARAGQQAIARLANAEAADHYGQTLALLETLPEGPVRDAQELTLRLAFAGPLSALGYEHPDTVANIARAEALCEGMDRGPARLPALVGLSVLHQAHGDLGRSERWARELLEIAEALQIAPLRLAAHAMLGAATASFSTIEESCAHFERVHELAATTPIPPPVAAFDLDVVAGLSGTYGMSLVLGGRPDQAVAQVARGLARARDLGHPYTLALALSTSALAAHFREDYGNAIALADECLRVTRGRGFVQNDAIAIAFRGWARVMLGDDAGAAQHEEGLALLHSSGAFGGVVQFYVAATEIALRQGQFEQAREHIDRVEAWVERLGQKTIAANVPMLRGELLIAESGDPREAERLLLESLAGWHKAFRSPWMELRSALGLGEVARRTGETAPARARLEKLVAGFSEGFETKRLREARAMIERLAP